jgi:ATP-dependent Clp protease ATP-binding subunit ClpA
MNRFDTQARLVFYYAREEARGLQHSRLAPGHLLLGLMHAEGGARDVLERLGAQLELLRSLFQSLCPSVDRVQVQRQLAFSPQIRRVIGGATREAVQLGAGVTSSQHLLLSLMNGRDAVLNQMLMSIQPDLNVIRKQARDTATATEQVVAVPAPEVPTQTRAALTQLLTLAEQGDSGASSERLLVVQLILSAGDRSLLPWLEEVVYRWLTEDRLLDTDKRSILHLLMGGTQLGPSPGWAER